YTLLLNPINHELVTLNFQTTIGSPTDLGTIRSGATVFDPNAPAAATLLSVLGRGGAQPPPNPNLDKLRQTVIDALLLVGGNEAGVLDAYGNQQNPSLTGNGTISATAQGVDLIAQRMARGDSMSLQDLLYALSFGFQWSAGPPTLDQWLVELQTQVN